MKDNFKNVLFFIKKNTTLVVILFLVMALPVGLFVFYKSSGGAVFLPVSDENIALAEKQLSDKNIKFQIADGGLIVPQDKISEASTIISNNLSAPSTRAGYEIFESGEIGLSDLSKRVGYTRALQGELEKTILMMEGVDDVRVHVNLPQKTRIGKVKESGSAGVYLKLRDEGYFSSLEYVIKELLASTLPGIHEKDVVIISEYHVESNRVLKELPKGLSIKAHLEEDYKIKAINILSNLLGRGNFVVELTVEINTDSKKIERSTPLSGKNADAGVLINLKDETVKSKTDKDSQSTNIVEKNYQVGMMNETTQEQEYQINSISVGVLLPRSLPPEEVDAVRKILISALSLDTENGDQITIAALLTSKSDNHVSDSDE